MKTITIRLERVRCDYKRRPLGELLSEAIQYTSMKDERGQENWLSRWAIRAVCEAVIAEKRIVLPLEVALKVPCGIPRDVSAIYSGTFLLPQAETQSPPEAVAMQTLEIDVPDVFLRLCEQYYKMNAARLAAAIIYSFCLNPPRELRLIQRAKEVGDDDEGDEWKHGPRD